MAARDQRRPARGRRAAHRLRAALGAEGAADPWPRRLRGPLLPYRRVAPRRRPRRQARRRDRHRLQRDPGRAGDPAAKSPSSTSTSAPRAGPSPRATSLTRARARALFKRFPALRRLDRASVYAFQEFGAAAMTSQRWLLPVLRAIGQRQIDAAIADPELRRKVTPSDEVGCKRIMLTDEWYPALAEPNVELVDRADRGGDAERHPRRDRRRAPGRRDRPRHRLRQPRLRRADGDRRPRVVAPWRRSGRRLPAPTSASACPAFPTCSCSTGRTPTAAPARWSTRWSAGSATCSRRCERWSARARAGSRSAARPRAASTASCAPPSPAPSGTAAAATGTSTRTATTRATGRGCGATYRRRTEQLEPGAYELSSAPAMAAPWGRVRAAMTEAPTTATARRSPPRASAPSCRRQLPRRPRDRAAGDRGLLRQRQDRRRPPPPAPRRLRPRRRLDRARRHRRRLGDLPQHPRRAQLHHDRAEAQRLLRRPARRRDRRHRPSRCTPARARS